MPGHTDSFGEDYLNLVASHALLPAHLLPTREGNCLDHVIARSDCKATTLVLDSLITDHAPVLFCCNLHAPQNCSTQNVSKLRSNIQAIVNELKDTDFSSVLTNENPEVAAENFIQIISSVINTHSRSVTTPCRLRTIKPWISPGLLRCIRHRDKLYKKMLTNPKDPNHKIVYIRYRTYCNNLLKKVKLEFHQNEFQKASNNPKASWNVIKQIANLNRKPSTACNLLKLCHTPLSSVDRVNDFFANVGQNLASKIVPLSSPFQNPISSYTVHASTQSPLNSMVLFSVENVEIESIILNLKDKSAVGWDGISTNIIKSSRHILIPILKHIINLSFSLGIFPRVFKRAVVHPVFKSGDRDSVTNYRPISVLTVLSKIMEKILNKRLLTFLDGNTVLSNNQFGFRRGKSTEDAILELTDGVIKNFDKKLKTIAVFLDLSKAFDTVSIPILLSKLLAIGVRGIVLELFSSYLSDRTQYVTIDGIRSGEQRIGFGVPQGSVLGPTLFLVYINELCNLTLPNCKIITYADDTALIIHGRNWQEAHDFSEQALWSVMSWLSNNLLTLNVSKTKFMTFSPSTASQPPSSYSIYAHTCSRDTVSASCSCTPLDRSSSIKYLGVFLDSLMTWKN